MTAVTLVTLVFGGKAATREQAIADHLDPLAVNAAIIEGLAGGSEALERASASSALKLVRVAPGCPCCTGNLTMRITLNRLLRETPARLFLSLADATHKEQVQSFLQEGQYQEHLQLGPELDCR